MKHDECDYGYGLGEGKFRYVHPFENQNPHQDDVVVDEDSWFGLLAGTHAVSENNTAAAIGLKAVKRYPISIRIPSINNKRSSIPITPNSIIQQPQQIHIGYPSAPFPSSHPHSSISPNYQQKQKQHKKKHSNSPKTRCCCSCCSRPHSSFRRPCRTLSRLLDEFDADVEDLDPTTHSHSHSESESFQRQRGQQGLKISSRGAPPTIVVVVGNSPPTVEMENVPVSDDAHSTSSSGPPPPLPPPLSSTNSLNLPPIITTTTTTARPTTANSTTNGNGNGTVASSNSDGNSPNPSQNPNRPRRRSALAIAERVTAIMTVSSLRRESRSRSRSGSDAVSPQTTNTTTTSGAVHANGNGNGVGGLLFRGRSRANTTTTTSSSRDHSHHPHPPYLHQHLLPPSGFTTEDDREESNSEDVHSSFSVEDSPFLEFGLLESDPFANLTTPPSECHSPLMSTRTWLQNLSTEVIREEPDEQLEDEEDDGEEQDKEKAKHPLHQHSLHFLQQQQQEQEQEQEQQKPSCIEEEQSPQTSPQQSLLLSKMMTMMGGERKAKRASTTSAIQQRIRFLSRRKKQEGEEETMSDGELVATAATTALDSHSESHGTTGGVRFPPTHHHKSDSGHYYSGGGGAEKDGHGDGGKEEHHEHEHEHEQRKRSNSFSERVRHLVLQSRPSLPSLSLLANTKIFLPGSGSGSAPSSPTSSSSKFGSGFGSSFGLGLVSRFPSEPWDDPKYTNANANVNATVNVSMDKEGTTTTIDHGNSKSIGGGDDEPGNKGEDWNGDLHRRDQRSEVDAGKERNGVRTVTTREEGDGKRSRSLFGGSSGGGGRGSRGGYYDQGRRDESSGDRHYSRGGNNNGSGNGNGREGDGGGRRGGNGRSSSSRTTSEEDTTTNSDDEDGDSEDDDDDDDDDDKPLGYRPNALSAQKSLRKKIKDERRSRKETIKSASPASLPLQHNHHQQQQRHHNSVLGSLYGHPSVRRSNETSSTTKTTSTSTSLHPDELTARLLRLRTSEGSSSSSLPASPTGRTAFPSLPTMTVQPLVAQGQGSSSSMQPTPRPSTSSQSYSYQQPQQQQQSQAYQARSPIKEQFSFPITKPLPPPPAAIPLGPATPVPAPVSNTSTFLFPSASSSGTPAPSSSSSSTTTTATARPSIQRHMPERYTPNNASLSSSAASSPWASSISGENGNTINTTGSGSGNHGGSSNGNNLGRPRPPMRSITSDDPRVLATRSFDIPTPTPISFPSSFAATTHSTSATTAPVQPLPPPPQQQQQQQPPQRTRSRADTLVQKLTGGSGSSVTGKLIRQRANSLHSSRAAPQLPPLPPLPSFAGSQEGVSMDSQRSGAGAGAMGGMQQQRVFIGDMQRFSVVEIGPRTNARDVLREIVQKGDLRVEEVESGDWMLFEVSNDFGMERPIREYEIVMEIYNSWNSDTRVNYFMAKRTPLTPYLAADAIPKTSPTFGGYVEWEHKRGKWTKRWLELREHALWLSKRQGAKDATVLCALSNFDAYTVTRIHKSPKPFVFSVKSVQNLRLFENMTDYHHVFCCEAFEGAQWFHHILVARSYVLHQERMVLFRQLSASKSKPSTAPSSATVSRAQSPSSKQGPSLAPLLSFGSSAQHHVPISTLPSMPVPPRSPVSDAFQPMPGSLLSKRM
ncbi:hypothetical protein FRC17_001982 [Serendipita sp. 399]|nr:hypothetical protein FRC17_001982 [Serendipita sp. 399]